MADKHYDVLLVQPPLSNKLRYGRLSKHGPNSIPHGLADIAAFLEKKGINVGIYDGMALSHTVEEAILEIKKLKPSIIGVSFVTPAYGVVKDLISKLRKEMPSSLIVLGGAHPTVLPKETLQEFLDVDLLVLGEGEITFYEIVKAFQEKKPYNNIDGIAYHNINNEIEITNPRQIIKNLDDIPLPAWHLLPMHVYRPTTSRYRKLPSFSLLTSRGCPMNCAFCSQTIGRQLRLMSVGKVMEQIDILAKKYGAKELIFYDSSFTLNRRHAWEICEELIRSKRNKEFSWSCETRTDMVDLELLKLMRRAGCWSIHYGVESGSQRLLNKMNKKIKLEQIEEVFNMTKKVGIHTVAFFMLGIPTETREETLKTIELAKKLKPHFAQFTITVPFPGTPLFEMAKSNGTFRADDWNGYQTWAGWKGQELIYVPEGRTTKEMMQLQQYAMESFIMQPRIILLHLANVIRYPVLLRRYLDAFFILLEIIVKNKLSNSKQKQL